jgi:hypothetical protein
MTAAGAVGRESGMTPKSYLLEMSALCVVFILLSLWGIVWDFTSGLLTSGIDGIMLLAICLMMGGIFSVMLVVMLWQAGLIPIFKPKEAKEGASAKPAAPAKAATPVPAASPAPVPGAAQAAPATTPAGKAAPPAQTTPTTK